MVIGCGVIPFIVAVVVLGAFFYVRANASAQLTVPRGEVLLVRAEPDESAPLLARFGGGESIRITGRTEDWRWLQVALWDNRHGWALRPLDILVWQIQAAPATTGQAAAPIPTTIAPVNETMVTIPATTFTMGSPPGLGENDERPAHPVSLSAFEIDQTEVTVGQYWQCVQAGECVPPGGGSSPIEAYLNDPAYDNYPVINVPWAEANRYCGWRGKRLPTEAEWELAASWDIERGAKLQWPWGNDPAQVQPNVGDSSPGQPRMVGSFPDDESPVGLMDMAGNVSEWVFDWYKVDYYSVADDTDPNGPTHRRGEGSGRVVRGGSYADPLEQARPTNRRHQDAGYGYPTVGFRCARDKE